MRKRCVNVDVYDAIAARRSVRRFGAEDVTPEIVDRLLQAAVSAPTAGNLQPWRFVVVRDAGLRRELVRVAHGQHFVGDAPVVVAVCVDLSAASRGYGRRGTELYAIQDSAAAIENLMLAAVAEGLATCWVGAFDEDAAQQVLAVEPGWRVLALIPLGHSRGEASGTNRRPLVEVVQYR